MAGALAHDASLESVVTHAVPPGTRRIAGAGDLRESVSWVVTLRSAGSGQIEGGELILVPFARVAEVLRGVRRLEAVGVAGLILEDDGNSAAMQLAESRLPIFLLPTGAGLRRVQADIERYLMRRRRELFVLQQHFHQSLVDAAVGGTDLGTLLSRASALSGGVALLDQDGEVVGENSVLDPSTLMETRLALLDGAAPAVVRLADRRVIASPVLVGKERRGTALLVAPASESDDPEAHDHSDALMSVLCAACAIVLSRSVDSELPTLDSMLSTLRTSDSSSDNWTALAAVDDAVYRDSLMRAFAAELRARGLQHLLGTSGRTAVALVSDLLPTLAHPIADALRSRTGSRTLALGIGRPGQGHTGAERSARQALDAVMYGTPGKLTAFSEIEILVLLDRFPAGKDFAGDALAQLLERSDVPRELMETLAAFLRQGRSVKSAAATLGLHRNTIQYRLAQIERLLGVDLRDPEIQFRLELATRILQRDRSGRPSQFGLNEDGGSG